MDEPQSFSALEHKLLCQHHDDYAAFTRLILSLAIGSFSLLAALGGPLLANVGATELARATFPLLLVSILAGVLVQHRIMMNPVWHLETAREQMHSREPGDESVIELRRRPSVLESWFYRIQVLSFLTAFVVLAVFMYSAGAP